MHSSPPRSSKPIWLSEATRKQQCRPADMPRLACRQSPKALRCHCVTHLCSQQRNLKAGARHHKLLHRHGVARGDEQVLQQPSQGQAMWCLNDDDRGSAAQSEQPSHEAQDGSASTGGPAGRRAASRLQWACLAEAHPAVDGVQPDGAGLHLRVPLHRVGPAHCKGQAAPALYRQAQQAEHAAQADHVRRRRLRASTAGTLLHLPTLQPRLTCRPAGCSPAQRRGHLAPHTGGWCGPAPGAGRQQGTAAA